MKDTAELRGKMLEIWAQIDSGKMSSTDARVHIGIARTVLDTLKVEIAAAHLNVANIPAVALAQSKSLKTVQGRRAA